MLDPNLHRQIMVAVLKDIYSDFMLGSILGFKGGTAAYLLYNLSRFSVDLDFDLLAQDKKPMVFEKVGKILAEYGKLEEKTDKYYTLFYLLSYKRGLQKLKVEISKRPILNRYEMKQFLGIPLFVVTQKDMFANKLVALTDRKHLAHRDIFDIHFFLKQHWQIDTKALEIRSGMKYKAYLKKCIRVIEEVPANSILTQMGELVDTKMKSWIKNHLKEDVLFLLKVQLTNPEH